MQHNCTVVITPEFSNDILLRDIAKKYDPRAADIPIHISLMYPFYSPLPPGELGKQLAENIEGARSFNLLCRGVSGIFSEYLVLNVKAGNDHLILLHDRLYSGPFQRYFNPRFTFIPHIVLGKVPEEGEFTHAIRELQKMSDVFETQVKSVTYFSIDANKTWHQELEIPLL